LADARKRKRNERFNAGVYDDEQADGLMAVLAFFPELD
jgi:hypothetical protein